jgi:hypothetical protein
MKRKDEVQIRVGRQGVTERERVREAEGER